MPPRRCCCNPISCDIATDDFNRADSTSVGANWEEESGDWAIESNKLAVHEAGVIRNLAVNPFGSNAMYISATIENLADDTRYRIILQMNADGSEYYYAEWYYVTDGVMYFTVGDEGGPLETTGPDSSLPEGSQINASMTDKNQLCMSDLSSRITVCVAPKPSATHRWGGLAAGNANGAAFDNYAAFATAADRSDCQTCDCTCGGWCLPDALIATLQELNECPDLDGLTIDLDNVTPIKFGTGWTQGSTFTCPDASGPITLRFECSDELKGRLTVEDSPLGTLGALDADPDVSTCRPLSLRFGPYSLGSVSGCGTTQCCGGNPCGTSDGDQSLFYVWITERLTDYDY